MPTPSAMPPLIRALLDPARYPHPTRNVELVETHISWLLLTGDCAYKIKKPVSLGFLDFSTLDRRRHFCEEELRLNRRYAPQLYEAIVPITGSAENPGVGGDGEPIEYAVRMRQFPAEQRLDRVLHAGQLSPAMIDDLAQELARQHANAAVAGQGERFGQPDQVRKPVVENFAQIRSRLPSTEFSARLDCLEAWCEAEFSRQSTSIAQRKAAGYIRECHGDLHLANLVLLDGRVVLFDCLEFNPALRWIDVQSDLAFAVMDLQQRGRDDLSHRLLNAYLQQSGDYAGLAVLPWYLVYRALVRATVAAIRAAQPDTDEPTRRQAWSEFTDYLALAERYTTPARPWLLIAHGVSGSGKTFHTQTLVEQWGAIRVRSDVERKRLAGLPATGPTAAANLADLYSPAAHQTTYARLLQLAKSIIGAGFPAIVDATFLRKADRAAFAALAAEENVPFAIVAFGGDTALLRQRIAARAQQGNDASDATVEVLDRQLQAIEPLTDDERAIAVTIAADGESADKQWLGPLLALIERSPQSLTPGC